MAVFNNPGGPPPVESEDCLYLNVYAPAAPPPPGGRAVMYWIYGGGLQFGTAGQSGYNGSALAAYQDVIIVTVNYRTNGELMSQRERPDLILLQCLDFQVLPSFP